MNKIEKFFEDIETFGAVKVGGEGCTVIYASIQESTVNIFKNDGTYYDHFDCGRFDTTMHLPQVWKEAMLYMDSMPSNIKNTLVRFCEDDEDIYSLSKRDLIVWLWNNTGAFDDIWGKHGTRHIEYKDDTEPLTPDEYRSHEQFFGETFFVLKELGRVFCSRFHPYIIERFESPDIRQHLYETRDVLHQLVSCMLDSSGLITDSYSTQNPEDWWASRTGSLAQRIEACYWLLSSVKREMDEEMDKNEDAYAFADQRVQAEIYKFCEKTMKEIEELRGMENADI